MPALLLAWSVVKESGFFTTGWLAFQVDVGKLNFLGFLHGFAHVIGKFDGIKHRFGFRLMDTLPSFTPIMKTEVVPPECL